MKKITVIPHISTLLALILSLSFLIPDAITVHAAENLSELQKAYDDALAQYNKGSAGFFESLMDTDPDAKEAYEIMMDMDGTHQYRTTENIRPYTDPADNMDAAFLDNMKMAIDFISTANALRENDTTLGSAPALYVTHTLMAISQLCCNRSSSEPIHCKAYNIGENLAWGYKDPFDVWYDEEKAMYLEGSRNNDEVGHYTSLMNPEFITTGFAIGQDPGNDVCHEESFQYDDANKKSVARYKSLFLEYYNKTRDALDEAEYNLKTGKTGDAYSGRYSDVSNKMWYYDVVERVSSLGLMTGTSDTEFSPNGTMSRAMVVTVLYRMAGQPAASGISAFKDVKDGLWYTAPINWAVENGIATGYNADSFGPNDCITREQICVMIYRKGQFRRG